MNTIDNGALSRLLNAVHSLFGIGFLIMVLFSCTPQVKQEFPNILWITIEDLSPHLGVYGDENAHTTNLDAFAAKSIRYTNAFATAPVCSPSRSCLITGYYASSLGTQHLRSKVDIPVSIKPYPTFLKSAGYYTTNNSKEDYNFIDTTIWDHSSSEAHWRGRNGNQPFFSVFNLMLTHQSSIFGNDSVYKQRIDRFLPYIQQATPDALILPPYYPDTPEIRKLWARYYTNISIVDYQFGQLLKELEEDGLMENTIVFFYSDHGTGVPRHKRALYDSGMKVPLMVSIPERYSEQFNFSPGTINDDMISFVDFVPTVLSLAGIEIPEDLPGTVFIGNADSTPKAFVYGASDRVDEGYELARSIRTKEYLYIRNYFPHLPLLQPNWYTDRSEIMVELNRVRQSDNLTGVQKGMFASNRPTEELYDVVNDPHQLNNLAADPSMDNVLEQLRNLLNEEVLRNVDTGFAPEPELIRLTKGTTPFEFVRNEDRYPLENILDVANLGLDEKTDTQEILTYMRHSNGLIRYWAVIAARSIKQIDSEVIEALQLLTKDAFPTVQIEAAALLTDLNQEVDMDVVVRHLQSDQPALVLYASRAFQTMAVDGKSSIKEARQLYEKLKLNPPSGSDFYLLYSFWALSGVFGSVN